MRTTIGRRITGVSLVTALIVAGVAAATAAANPAMAITGSGSHPVWVVQPTPNPNVQRPHPYMTDVSCASANACMAVGTYFNSNMFAERWSGTAWQVQSPSNPIGGAGPSLLGVSCSAASACMAVGNYNTTHATVGLAERWNGSAWAMQPTPSPAGFPDSSFNNVSCTSATLCTAVGAFSTGGQAYFTLAEQWNGSTWAIQPTPNPPGSSQSQLLDVSCTSSTACSAVGYYYNASNHGVTLAEQWNGSTWAIQPTPNPAGATYSSLGGLSCTSATACTAVGYSFDASGDVTLAERWNGSTWAIQPTPNPGGSAGLGDVSCISATECTALASYTDAGTGQGVMAAAQWNGSTWAIQPTPNPGGRATLRGVSCISGPKCTAVGSQSSVGTGQMTLAERYS